jgi:4-hydroxythreonine-4-phosphate dehydrogenase
MGLNKIVVTMGDPAGIGPEIICKLILDKQFCSQYDLTFVGSKTILKETFKSVFSIDLLPECNFIDVTGKDKISYSPGVLTPENGRLSIKYIAKAFNLIKAGEVDAMVTCPINKKAINLAGLKYPGHTEYLGFLSKSDNFSMMLVGDKIKVVLVTTHIPIGKVAESITEDKIIKAITNSHNAGKFFGSPNPKIAVAGLNPHAGDNGAIALEELQVISPAVNKCVEKGVNVHGPIPSDTLFARMLKGEFDIAVVMYHDQGLIPVKMESFGSAVNVTLNLPFIRTSVDHGTAYDIAGKGVASESSLKRAIEVADMMVNNVKSNTNI